MGLFAQLPLTPASSQASRLAVCDGVISSISQPFGMIQRLDLRVVISKTLSFPCLMR
jgi:hypothetical protein